MTERLSVVSRGTGHQSNRIRAVVFDFDGLLMDTESTLVEAWWDEWAFHGLELDLDDDFWPGHGGDVTQHRLARLGALVGPAFDPVASLARFHATRERLHRTMDLCPGIRDWLAEAQALGLVCGIASSSPLARVRGHLSRAGVFDVFHAIATGDEVRSHKPDPAVYRLALARLGIAAHRALAVEDTPHGVVAASAAGMAVVAIPNRFIRRDEFATGDMVLSSAADHPLATVLAELTERS